MSVPDVSGACIANLEVETLRHKNPVFHGDTIYAETRVLDGEGVGVEARPGMCSPSSRRASTRTVLEVCYFRRRILVWKRDAAPPRRRPYGDDVWGE